MNEVTTTESNLPAEAMNTAWGSAGTSSSDMLIPRIQLMQALSDLVAKSIATPGDIVDSLNNDILAKKGKSVEFIPIMSYKTWIRSKMEDGAWKFFEQIPVTAQNESLPYEQDIEGDKFKNVASLNFFVVLPTMLNELPYLISFKGSSYAAGKKLSTHFQVSQMKGKPPAMWVFSLGSSLKTVDKHNFHVFEVTKTRESKKEELSVAYNWWKTLSQSQAKVQEETEEAPF